MMTRIRSSEPPGYVELPLDLPELTQLPGPRSPRLALWLGALALFALLSARLLETPPPHYTTQPARVGALEVTVTATGPLQPTEQVDVGSELSGTLRSVDVGYNDRVQAGQVLAQLDTTRLEAQALQAKASLEAAGAALDEARASEVEAKSQLARLQRVREISGGKLPSEQELAAAQSLGARARGAVRSAEAAVAQAKATLDVQQTDLARAVIRSPIDGVVLAANARPGQTVAASLQAPVLFTLAGDLAELHLHLSVDEADVGKVHEGQPVRFAVDAWPGRSFSGRVEQVRYGAHTQAGVVSYETIATVENPDLLLRPGMTATAEILVQRDDDVLLAPNAALRFEPPKGETGARRDGLAAWIPDKHRFDLSASAAPDAAPHVWVLKQGRPQRVAVEVGPSDGSWTEIRGDGLAAGAKLVVDADARS
ncbi:MAG TPA: efflux RND transporter periplasmic adaptor subunit [Myxococcota bacterium]|nr:efflux RND transporter periplasmic adaptor subunit [Myxococcota bacterium]